MADLFWFSDAQWARIEPLLPKNTRRLKRVDDRRVLSGIVHVLKTGCRWCDLPAEYGPKKTIYNRFVRWAERGIWEDVFAALAGRGEAADGLMIDATIDATIVRAHLSAGGAKGGASPWYWSQQGRQDNQDPCGHRRERPPARPRCNARKHARYRRCKGLRRSAQARPLSDRRQGLRQ